jgi:hypothetical protein
VIETAERLLRRAFEVFAPDTRKNPSTTLRGGNAIDGYAEPEPDDAAIDAPTDTYLERYALWGVAYLDAASWRHYLPHLVAYGLRHLGSDPHMVVDALLSALRPPDRVPSRLASLTEAQEAVVREFLERLAFGDEPNPYRDLAMQVLEEWWLPNALYRRP